MFLLLPHITAPIWSLPSASLVLTDTLGEGSFSTVFKGKWKDKIVAVKKISMYKFTPKEVRLENRLPKRMAFTSLAGQPSLPRKKVGWPTRLGIHRVSVYGRHMYLEMQCVCKCGS